MTDLLHTRTITDVRDKYRRLDGEYVFTGIQALVRVPFDALRADREAGHRTRAFVSGYQGSPLGTLDLELGRQSAIAEELGLVFNPGLNEELAATSVMGSQLVPALPNPTVDGVIGIWYGKAPGLDRATDALRHANYAGTSRLGGALAYVGDDPAAKSSSLPSSSDYALHDLHMPTLFPGNVQEILDLGAHGIAMSRASGLWTAVKIVSAVADGSGVADVTPDRIVPVMPVIEHQGGIWNPFPDGGYMAYQSPVAEQEIAEVRQRAALRYVQDNPGINEITVNPGDAWLGLVASGRTYYEVVEALHLLGLSEDDLRHHGVRLLRLGMITPLDPDIVRRFADGLDEVVVVEDSGPFLEVFIRDLLYGRPDAPRILGRRDELGQPLLPGFGSHVADTLIEPLTDRLTRRIPVERLDRRARLSAKLAVSAMPVDDPDVPPSAVEDADDELPVRQAYFCSGCPHNSSTKVPDGTLVGAGIGCHSMVALMDEDRVGKVLGITQMGGEGTQWIGMSPFVEADHIVQNLGDGTLSHSGSLAIRASIAAGTNVTYKVLYNSAVAMTGGQDVPGLLSPIDLAREVLLEGAAQVVITTDVTARYRWRRLPDGVTVRPREDLIAVQEELAEVPGVTVLIHDQQCAAEKRRDRKRGKLVDPPMRIVINERVCEGCGDCGDTSNCLSVQPVDTEFGRKTRIDQSSCNKDYSCLRGDCPSFLTVEPVEETRLRRLLARWRRPEATTPAPAVAPVAGSVPELDGSELIEPERTVGDDVTIRMPGIGGTGVITVSQILATAAALDGRHVQGLDQTGFSQKAGAVISDVRISDQPIVGTNQATAGSVDLYLVFDLLVALAEKNLAATDPERTVAIVSTSRTPTGRMVTDTSASYPATDSMLAELAASTRGDRLVSFDATELATALFGSATTANILTVGAAFQSGALPISAASIEAAIELNGAAVKANIQAFRYGRLLVQDRTKVEAAASRSAPAPDEPEAIGLLGDLDEGELGRLLRVRVPDLIGFQNEALAREYLEVVRAARRAERAVDPSSTAFAEAVARGHHKLLAYKDEYEVARLHLMATDEAVAAAVPGKVRYRYNLHPPVLRALGMDRKIRLGRWFDPVLRILAAGKVVRGTPFDVFGYAKVRRVERHLIREYRDAIDRVAGALSAENLDAAVAVAELPDVVRGYEDIKLANVERFRAELARGLEAFAPTGGRRWRRG